MGLKLCVAGSLVLGASRVLFRVKVEKNRLKPSRFECSLKRMGSIAGCAAIGGGINVKQEKRMEKGQMSNRRQTVMLAWALLIMATLTVAGLIYVRTQISDLEGDNVEAYGQMERHYAFITDSMEDKFSARVYEGAKKVAEEEKIFLEWFGSGLAVDYSKEELLKIAIAANVDGIIVEGDGSEKTQKLINKAVEEGIPVVTVMTDSYDSMRQSFVGISSHNLGREYGRQIVKVANKETKRALILMSAAAEDSGQNLVFNGILETIANEGNHLNLELTATVIDGDSAFGEEVAIRNIFLNREDLPEIIVCLNEDNSISAYQAAVDYNLVGQVSILGYSVDDTILDAISRNVIDAACVVDYEQMGFYCIKALDEYIETGHVNDFVTMDVSTVTKDNVERYLENAQE